MKQLAAALVISLAATTPALAGPPWLGIEIRPFNGGVVLVHTFHHGIANPMDLRGSAEGLVDGRRVSIPLRFDATSDGNNTYQVAKTWGETGVWALNIVTASDLHGGAAAVVLIDRNGAVTVRYPRQFDGLSRAATAGEINAMLAALDAGGSPHLARTGWFSVLGARMLLPLAAVAVAAFIGLKLALRGVSRFWQRRERPAVA